MSPRRRVEADEPDYFRVEPTTPRRWGLTVLATVAGLVIVAALTVSTLMLIANESDRRAQARDASALGYVSEFMTAYTTLDPFNANAYTDRIVAQGTGEFETMFKERIDEIAVQVARAEPTTGVVMAAGVQRWYDDGSVDVLVATKTTAEAPDGNSTVESGNRWVVTATTEGTEGQQWKISQLIQVI